MHRYGRDDARFLAAYGDATEAVTYLRDAVTKVRIERGDCAPSDTARMGPQ